MPRFFKDCLLWNKQMKMLDFSNKNQMLAFILMFALNANHISRFYILE